MKNIFSTFLLLAALFSSASAFEFPNEVKIGGFAIGTQL